MRRSMITNERITPYRFGEAAVGIERFAGIVLLGACLAGAFAADHPVFVGARRQNTPVYAQELSPIYAQAAFTIQPWEKLQVIAATGDKYQVCTPEGLRGWVSRTAVSGWLESRAYAKAVSEADKVLEKEVTLTQSYPALGGAQDDAMAAQPTAKPQLTQRERSNRGLADN